MAPQDDIFVNRDLSWLSFNYRVLLEAADRSVPLYNRISFLSIFSSNLDEFFRVRMPAIFAFTSIKGKKTNLRDEYPKDLVQLVQSTIQAQLEKYGRILTDEILPELKENRICLYYASEIQSGHREVCREYFLSNVLSFLQPVHLKDSNKEEVFLENNALYFLIDIEANDRPGNRSFALLNIPSSNLPRFLELPTEGEMHYIVFLDDVIRENLHDVFPGFTIHHAWSIKLTRDAELNIDDEFTGNLAEKIEKQLDKREAGPSTRFLFENNMSPAVQEFVKDYLGLRTEEMIAGGRYHNLKDLGNLPNPFKGKLEYKKWPPAAHPGFHSNRSIFQTIQESQRVLHLPYHSYNYILRFFNEAAIDPHVKEIFVTLYRVAADSLIANALVSAARNGKKVTVFVELKARFDEANNLRWSKKMKAAGVRIINSIPGLKVHAKVALVKRTEQKEVQHFSFMGTGNFNEATGRFYTDHVFFTSDPVMGKDLQLLFDYLLAQKYVSRDHDVPFKQILVSQFNMVSRFKELIDREISHAKKGLPAGIIIKVNNLQEREMISKLYEASRAGVRVRLIVRGICSLAPGIAGQSENITIHRIVDRYLEHARVFVFHNNGQPEYFMGSADWMNRNLHSRIEVCFPVSDPGLVSELQRILDIQLDDKVKGVLLSYNPANGSFNNLRLNGVNGSDAEGAQERIYKYVQSLSGMQ